MRVRPHVHMAMAMAIAMAIVACAPAALQVRNPGCPFLDAPATLLNSERIERCFGSYGVELLTPRDGLRVARLNSGKGQRRVTRTLALTALEPEPPTELAPVLALIEAGASLGSTLADAGWAVTKDTFMAGPVAATAPLLDLGGFANVLPEASLALHAYRLMASRDGRSFLVARIAEVHHPDYLAPGELAILHPQLLPASATDRQFLADVMRVLD